MLKNIEEKVLGGSKISRDEALFITSLPGQEIFDLISSANRIRHYFRGDSVDLCAIINAKSGACSEDCSYCAQSAKSTTEINTFQLVEKERVMEKAEEAKKGGAKRFCIVTSGKKASPRDLAKIASMVSGVRRLGLLPCATLGLQSKEDLLLLKDAGLERYHNNLETSEGFFPEICTTHTYRDKIETIRAVKSAGLSLCSGGIFGLGETWEDRIDMAFELRDIGPDSVPINFLTPVKGTRLGLQKLLDPFDALKIISLYRFILPDKEIRVCGGRIQTLGELHSFIFPAGADGLLTGNYLTTLGRNFEGDLKLIDQYGLRVR
jgi:biotin synthase